MGKGFPDEAIPLLGKYPDEQVAKMVRCKKSTVAYNRRKHGRAACHPEMARRPGEAKAPPPPASPSEEKSPDLTDINSPLDRARARYLEIRRNLEQAEERGAFTALASLRKVEGEALATWEAEAARAEESGELTGEALVKAWHESLRKFSRQLPRGAVATGAQILTESLRPKPFEVIEGGEKKEAVG